MASNDRDGPRSLLVDLATTEGGASQRGLTLLTALPAGSAALAALAGGSLADRARVSGIEVHSLGARKWDPRVGRRLTAAARAPGFDVLDAQNPQAKAWSVWAVRATGAALVSTVHSWAADEFAGSVRGFLYRWVELAAAREARAVIAVSTDIAERLEAAGLPKDRVVTIPGSVALDVDRIPGDRRGLAARLGMSETATLVCAVGRLVEIKGHSHLLSAVAKLVAGGRDVCCVIVGAGRLHERLEQQAAELAIHDRVRVIGGRSHGDTLSILKSSDVFVMPSLVEGTPIALLEAAALDRPIVATRVGGIPVVIEDGKHGLLVPPGDVEALHAALDSLCARPELGRRLAREARERVALSYSPAAMATATREVYRRACARDIATAP
jgi:glycosyltransferase involved in cell wall biosynthesis